MKIFFSLLMLIGASVVLDANALNNPDSPFSESDSDSEDSDTVSLPSLPSSISRTYKPGAGVMRLRERCGDALTGLMWPSDEGQLLDGIMNNLRKIANKKFDQKQWDDIFDTLKRVSKGMETALEPFWGVCSTISIGEIEVLRRHIEFNEDGTAGVLKVPGVGEYNFDSRACDIIKNFHLKAGERYRKFDTDMYKFDHKEDFRSNGGRLYFYLTNIQDAYCSVSLDVINCFGYNERQNFYDYCRRVFNDVASKNDSTEFSSMKEWNEYHGVVTDIVRLLKGYVKFYETLCGVKRDLDDLVGRLNLQ